MKHFSVSLGMTINIGNFNSVRAEVTAENAEYAIAFEEARTKLFDAIYHIAKEVHGGLNKDSQVVTVGDEAIRFLASKLTEEPRI